MCLEHSGWEVREEIRIITGSWMAHGPVATERSLVWENFGEGSRWVLNRRETRSDLHLHGFLWLLCWE